MPFCTSRCDYCAFATWTDRHHLQDAYVEALLAEATLAAGHGEVRPATSVFVGGGTPSLLGGPRLARLLEAVDRLPDAEVTVECNPETTTAELLDHLAAAGVTRCSLGVQSMAPHVLAGLGRHHDPDEVRHAVTLLGAAGMAEYNVDLIYGGAGEHDEDWLATLEAVLSFDPPPTHVSAYALTVEAGTPLWRDPSRHPDDDVQARRYGLADQVLSTAGFEWYEVSNWARPGHECRHNRTYWHQGDYRGLGCAAHSHVDGRRWWNVHHLDRYLAAVTARRSALAGEERLGHAERVLEGLQLALRTRDGVPLDAFPPDRLALLEDGGPQGPLLSRNGDRAVLTLRGRLLCNLVAGELSPRELTTSADARRGAGGPEIFAKPTHVPPPL